MEGPKGRDPRDRRFPFNRELFEDLSILYHGTWSTYAHKIESEGLINGALPFDWRYLASVFRANNAIGLGSYLRVFLGSEYPRVKPSCDLFLNANFWFARSYATSRGGEAVCKAIEEAERFERISNDATSRAALKAHWEEGLREHPDHAATLAAVGLLGDDQALRALYSEVKVAREYLTGLTTGGCPVVYAIRVQPSWFGDQWAEYAELREFSNPGEEFRCKGNLISRDRIIARVMYPNGTEADFLPTWHMSWQDGEGLVAR